MKRFIKYLLLFSMFFSLIGISICNAGKEKTKAEEAVIGSYNGIVYSICDGEAEVLSYIGSETTLEIPETLDGAKVTIISHKAFQNSETLEYIKIPNGVKVIYNEAFYNCTKLTTVEFPASVTQIHRTAFYLCDKLTTINVSEDNETYASINGALYDKDKTTLLYCPMGSVGEYIIPDGVEKIGCAAFERCKLTSVVMPDSIKSIESLAFMHSENLTSVVFSKNLESIGSKAFAECYDLGTIELSDSLTSIGDEAFDSCTKLKIRCKKYSCAEQYAQMCAIEHTCTDLLTTDDGFEYCIRNGSVTIAGHTENGSSIIIPEEIDGYKVTRIGDYAFAERGNLTTVEIPESVTSIGERAFFYCNNLKIIEISSNVTEVGDYAFINWHDLVIICERGSYIDKYAIENEIKCDYGNVLTTDAGIQYYLKSDGVAIVGCVGEEEYIIIPEEISGYKVNSIEYGSFKENTYLKTIEIPSSVTRIDKGAFSYFYSLEKIIVSDDNRYYSSHEGVLLNKDKTIVLSCPKMKKGKYVIPEGVKEIGESAFESCDYITSIELPVGVTKIGDCAFMGCGIRAIKIPEGVRTIGHNAFKYCYDLYFTEIPNTVSSIGEYAFDEINEVCIVCKENSYAEKFAVENEFAYTNDITILIWDEYKYYIENDSITIIEYNGDSSCIEIPNKIGDYRVEHIGKNTFFRLSDLEMVIIPEGVLSIEEDAFYNCINVDDVAVVIPKSVTYISDWAFVGGCRITIHCEKDSYALEYAMKQNIPYVLPSVNDCYVEIEQETYVYTGCEIKPAVTVKKMENGVEKVLIIDKEYKVVYSNNIRPGLATINIIGIGDYEGETAKQFLILPSGITGLTYSNITTDSIVLEWDKNDGVDEYVIEYYMFGEWLTIEIINSNEITSYTVTNLCADTEYQFRIRGYSSSCDLDEYTRYSENSEIISVKTLANLPEIPEGTPGETPGEILVTTPTAVEKFDASVVTTDSITLGWEMNTSASGYILEQYIDGEWIYFDRKDSNEETNCVIYGLRANTLYQFRIAAFSLIYDEYGCEYFVWGEYSETLSVRTLFIKPQIVPPSDVTGFTASKCTATSITLKWDTNASAAGYEIEQYIDGKWIIIKTIMNNETVSHKVIGLSASTKYKFRIVSYKDDAELTESICPPILSVKTKAEAPATVKNFTKKTSTTTSITLKWTKNTSAAGYVIEQYKGGKWVTIKNIYSNTITSHQVKGLKAGTTYKFRIKAYKKDGTAKVYSSYTSKSIKTLPSIVKSFTYKTRTATSITLKWTKNASADGYVIQQYKNGKWVTIKNIYNNATVSYQVKGLKAGTTYKFRIKAYKKDGSNKLYSSYTNKSIKTLPSNVANFTYKARTKTSITLKWKKNTSADGYVVQQYKSGKWVTVKTITKNSTVSYKVLGLKKSTTYKFRIRTYKMDGSNKIYSKAYTIKQVKTLK